MAAPQLFPYQQKTVNNVYDHIRNGRKRVLLVAPTGSGKTNMGAYIAKDAAYKKRKTSFIVHRENLIDQAVRTFEKWGLSCGVVAGGRKENRAADVQICSYQALTSRDTSWMKSGLVMADECLSGDSLISTLSGNFRIDDPSIVGKLALSYNEYLQRWEYKQVERQIFKGYRQTLTITTKNHQIRCTNNHLIRTAEGWKRADSLKPGTKILSPCVSADAVISYKSPCPCKENHKNQFLTTLPSVNTLINTPQHRLHKKVCVQALKQERLKKSSLLSAFPVINWGWFMGRCLGTPQLVSLTKTLGLQDSHLLMDCPKKNGQISNPLDFQSYAFLLSKSIMQDMGKSVSEVEALRTGSLDKFLTLLDHTEQQSKLMSSGSAISPLKVSHGGIWMMDLLASQLLVDHRLEFTQKATAWQNANCWQNGLLFSLEKTLPYLFVQKKENTLSFVCAPPHQSISCDRSVATQFLKWNTNLEEVLSIESASVEPVYDLTIADNHNFVANGLLVHNCHTTAFTDIMLQWFPKNHFDPYEIPYIGLTATPFRSKKRESLGEIFQAIALAPSYKELIAMGNLVKPVYYDVPNSSAGDMIADASYIIRSWREIAQNSLTIAFTQSVDFAKVLADAFNQAGITAAAITEETPIRTRRRIYDACENDEIKVLCSCLALAEGFDLPKARVAILARNTQSLSLFVQAVGRVMRAYFYPDGTPKTDCIILDQMGVVKRFGFVENLIINESALFVDDDEPGHFPTKTCPRCKKLLPLAARVCDSCGFFFNPEFSGKDRYLPDGNMRRVFQNDAERSHYAVYVRMLQKAFAKKLPLSWADKSFLEKFNYFPPTDWRRNAIIKSADESTKAEFREYLLAIAQEENRDPNWITRQLSLELGL